MVPEDIRWDTLISDLKQLMMLLRKHLDYTATGGEEAGKALRHLYHAQDWLEEGRRKVGEKGSA